MGQLSKTWEKDLILFTLVSLCLLQPVCQAFFFGPIGVGLGVGLLAAGGGFLLGTSLSRTRSRNMGEARCKQLYNRCDTSTEDMVKMIQTEFENMKEIEKDLDNSVDAEAQITKEKSDLMKEFKENKIDLDKNWNWA